MTKPVMIGAAVLLIAVGGGAAYLVITNGDDDNDTQTSTQTDNTQTAANTFDPASTEGLEFKATITTTGGETEGTSTIEHDEQGNTRYVATQGGQEIEFIYTSDAYYSCQGDNCIKYALSESNNSGFNPSDYTYDAARIASYRTGSTYLGQEACGSSTCDVWTVSSGGTTSKIFIDADSKRIIQVESTISGVTSKITYDYTDVTIEVPENAQEINLP